MEAVHQDRKISWVVVGLIPVLVVYPLPRRQEPPECLLRDNNMLINVPCTPSPWVVWAIDKDVTVVPRLAAPVHLVHGLSIPG